MYIITGSHKFAKNSVEAEKKFRKIGHCTMTDTDLIKKEKYRYNLGLEKRKAYSKWVG